MKEIQSWTGSIALALLIALIIGIFVIQPSKVSGHSMDPTLHNKQRIYISKILHTFRYEPNYSDIVIIDSRVERKRTFKDDIWDSPLFSIFKSRKTQEADEGNYIYVKRVIAKPGDVLEFRDNRVFRNGEALVEPYIKEAMRNVPDRTITVPDDCVFVMGDNRNHSTDSRSIGCIPLDHVLGKKI